MMHPHVFIVSDLHLGDTDTPEVDPFRSDAEFASFVTAYLPERTLGEPTTLVIAGDFIDFPRIRPCFTDESNPTLGNDEATSVGKLKQALSGHGGVVAALAEHVSKGNQLVILPGNHDVDLVWPGVQDELAQRLGEPERLVFVREGFIRSGGLYVEHGHQQSEENRFSGWPDQLIKRGPPPRLERCWGTFFMEAAYNLLEGFAPWISMVHPTWKAVWLALKHRGWEGIPPPVAAAVIGFLARFGKKLVWESMMDDARADGILHPEEIEARTARLPAAHRAEILESARALASQSPMGRSEDEETPPSGAVLGRTNEAGIRKRADLELSRPEVHSAVFGHTHHAMTVPIGDKVMVNSGTWTGMIDIDQLPRKDFASLCEAAKSPLHRRSFVYFGPDTPRAALDTYHARE